MGKIISFGIQKGGSGKTTSAGITAYILSQQKNKVLCVDMDSQGNLTELMTQRDIYDYHGMTILEALKEKEASKYIHKVSDNLDILTAEDLLATLPRYLYTEYKGNRSTLLKETLDPIKDQYDYIIIDTPPALGDQTINALTASDFAVAMFESSKFCYSALERYYETVKLVQEQINPELKIAGILRTMIDSRRSDAKVLIEVVEEEYPDDVFKTVIKRKAATGRININGFIENTELQEGIDQYMIFLKELINRVENAGKSQKQN